MNIPFHKMLSWHWIHSFLGLWCSLILTFIFLTGTLSLFAAEIDWLLDSERRASGSDTAKIALSETYGAANAHRPDHTIVRLYRSDASYIADQVEILTQNGKRYIWVDPYAGTVNGETGPLSVREVIAELHTRLFIPGRLGIMAVTVFSLALTGSLIAGIFLLPRFWKSFVTKPRFGGSKRALYSDVHRLLGAWSIPFVAIIALTTLYYFAETLNLDAPPIDRGVNTEPRAAKQPDDMSQTKIEGAIAAAKEIYPELQINTILLPRDRVQPIRIQGQLSAMLVRERANTVYLHPETLDVIRAHKGEDLSAHQRISEAVDPIHWGYWGGIWSRLIWLFFGIILTALPLLGAVIFAKRMGVRRAKLEGVTLSGWRVYWDGMGLGKWGAIGLILIAFLLAAKTLMSG